MESRNPLDAFFYPSSVAVVPVPPDGAGQLAAGRRYLDYLLDYSYRGSVYPINRKGGQASGLEMHASLQDVPGPVDLVISCIPAAGVTGLIEECADKEARAVILHTAGFSETGRPEGRQLEAEAVRLARAAGIRMVGPNCMGVYCPRSGLTFAYDFPRDPGPVALICQSGSNALFPVRAAAERGVRYSKVVSYGNACDVDESDLLGYLAKDEDTGVVAAYIEGVKDGRRFLDTLSMVSAAKPVIVLKAGSTGAGVRAAASHTGSMAGSEVVWGAALSQAGALRVHSLDEMVDMMASFQFLRPPKGRRVAIFGVGGGASVLATDDVSAAGFSVPPLPDEIRQQLRAAIASDAGTMLDNPIDYPFWTLPQDAYCDILRTVLEWEDIDSLLFLAPLRHTELSLETYLPMLDWQFDSLIRVAPGSSKPVAVVLNYLASGESWRAAVSLKEKCSAGGLPVYHSVASAATALARLADYHAGTPAQAVR